MEILMDILMGSLPPEKTPDPPRSWKKAGPTFENADPTKVPEGVY